MKIENALCGLLCLVAFVSLRIGEANAEQVNRIDSSSRTILAHYMPWYTARPVSQTWGWHWTMNCFDPEEVVDGKWQIASHYYPLIAEGKVTQARSGLKALE